MRFDRTPPQSLDAERSVLGAILLNESVWHPVSAILSAGPSAFYIEAHQHIYAAMQAVKAQGKPLDVVTLMDGLIASGRLESIGGASYISDLTGAVPTSAFAEHYAHIVREKASLRGLIESCARITRDCYAEERPSTEILDMARRDVIAIGEQSSDANPILISEAIEAAVDHIEADAKSQGKATGWTTGIGWLDYVSRGLHPEDLFLVGARPSVGKTALGLQIARASANAGAKVLYASYEMGGPRLVQRMLYAAGRINATCISRGFNVAGEMGKLPGAVREVSALPIWTVDTKAGSPSRLRAAAQRHMARHGLDILIVDHFHLMEPDARGFSEVDQYSTMSRALKNLACELQIPVVVLCQLNRDAAGQRATLKHLRGAGGLEQDADKALMLTSAASLGDAVVSKLGADAVIFDLQKHRNGAVGECALRFNKAHQIFEPMGEGHQQSSGIEPYEESELLGGGQAFDEYVDDTEEVTF